MEHLMYAESVALELGISTRTLDLWYRWKRNNHNHPLAALLPEYTIVNKRRVWRESDIDGLRIFKDSKPNGRSGLFGTLTYRKKEK